MTGEIAFPGKSTPIGYLLPNGHSALKTYIQVALHRLSGFHFGIYVYMCVCIQATTINEKGGNGFVKEQGGYMGRFRGKKMKKDIMEI